MYYFQNCKTQPEFESVCLLKEKKLNIKKINILEKILHYLRINKEYFICSLSVFLRKLYKAKISENTATDLSWMRYSEIG